VNLGSTTPGHLPGEVSAGAGDYRRWFPEMAALGIKVIRVYTLLDPSFYRELRRYDLAHPKAPLYVIHGVWIPEERFLTGHDLWDPAVVERAGPAFRGGPRRGVRQAPARAPAGRSSCATSRRSTSGARRTIRATSGRWTARWWSCGCRGRWGSPTLPRASSPTRSRTELSGSSRCRSPRAWGSRSSTAPAARSARRRPATAGSRGSARSGTSAARRAGARRVRRSAESVR
jgi:hypothetical protein